MSDSFSYAKAGIDINQTDQAKKGMSGSLASKNPRVLNRLGAFASLYDGHFPQLKHPILVMKTEEPGSKQKLAAISGKLRSVCFDMINHLVNDLMVMGAKPLAVQDAIILGKTDQAVIQELVAGVADACRANDCDLTGGETSIQPGVLEPGTFILTSSIVGIVDKDAIIDGSTIVPGDSVIAIASNGLHTNGYTLVRALMDKFGDLAGMKMQGDNYNRQGGRAPNLFAPESPETFFDVIMRPHTDYYRAVRDLFGHKTLHGMAHITGGGIQDNLSRIIPSGCSASLDKSALRILPVFAEIKHRGSVEEGEMLRTFNCGVGLCIVCESSANSDVIKHLKEQGLDAYLIGGIVKSGKQADASQLAASSVTYYGLANWQC